MRKQTRKEKLFIKAQREEIINDTLTEMKKEKKDKGGRNG
jgi:hypothetical protein